MKKFTTKLLALFMAATLAATAIPAPGGGVAKAAAVVKKEFNTAESKWVDVEKDELKYTLLGGVLTISGNDYMGGFLNGYPWDSNVSEWNYMDKEDYAWYTDSGKIEKVIIGDSVKSIAGSAFVEATNLKEVEIGAGVEFIGAFAFGSGSETIITFMGDEAPELGSKKVFGYYSEAEYDFLPNSNITVKFKDTATGFLGEDGNLNEDWAAIKNDYQVKFLVCAEDGREWEPGAPIPEPIVAKDLDIIIPDTVHVGDKLEASTENMENGYRYYWSVTGSNIESKNYYSENGGKPYEFSSVLKNPGKTVISIEVRDNKFKNKSDKASGNVIGTATKEFTVTDHNYVGQKNKVDATCTKDGKKADQKCSICGDVIPGKVIPATGHKEVSKVTKATTKANGKITYTCSVCNETTTKAKTIASIDGMTINKSSFVYNKKIQKPSVTVKDSKGKTIAASNYTVSYSKGSKDVGKYTVTVKFKGNYDGKLTKSYNIVPKATKIASLTKAKKAFTAKWDKQDVQTDGYEIAYSTDMNFKANNTKTVTIKKTKTVSKKISGLKAGQKYYVKVRTYKTIDKKPVYSSWSNVKTVTTPK